jgi:DNA-binding response OmpR family regulator
MQRLGSILLVDDEETFREAICRLLRREGFDCHCAADGDKGVEILQDNRFDLLIADIRMPGNHDLRLVKAARDLDNQMPVILVTGYPSTETAVHSIDLSVASYLTKPLEISDLLCHVKPAVAHCRNRRALASILGRLQSCIDDLSGAQWNPIPRVGEKDEMVSIGTIRTLAACLSELLGLLVRSEGEGITVNLCELLDCPQRPVHRKAILDTIAVLKRTKEAFKSKELAELRKRLEGLLGNQN